jgi:hypothetical protein
MMNEAQYVPGMMGCSDGGCIFAYKAPGTMVTNGGCQCMKELTRTDVGFRAYRTILWLRQNQPLPAFAGMDNSGHSYYEYQQASRPVYRGTEAAQRTMGHKVNMIKDIREQARCGLKEAKEAMDAVYDSCSTFDQVVELGVAYALRPKGYCRMGDNCVCGGDVPAVRAGCFEWKAL